jgi:hypothetical protein
MIPFVLHLIGVLIERYCICLDEFTFGTIMIYGFIFLYTLNLYLICVNTYVGAFVPKPDIPFSKLGYLLRRNYLSPGKVEKRQIQH